MHGDLLCTDDLEYQQFRKLTHTDEWQEDLLNKPLQERLAIAQHYRIESLKNKAKKSMDIMDVNQAAVVKTMRENNVRQLIHGHTHRPNIHTFLVEEQTAKRFVLAEWDLNGSVLDFHENGYDILELP